MNLHQIVSGAIGVVNPQFLGDIVSNTGYTTAPSGRRTETTQTFPNVLMQVQPLTMKEIDHLDSLNIQGTLRAVHLNGNVQGLNRVSGKGGDVLMIPTKMTSAAKDTWLVVAVLERFDADGWCRVAVSLQVVPQSQ